MQKMRIEGFASEEKTIMSSDYVNSLITHYVGLLAEGLTRLSDTHGKDFYQSAKLIDGRVINPNTIMIPIDGSDFDSAIFFYSLEFGEDLDNVKSSLKRRMGKEFEIFKARNLSIKEITFYYENLLEKIKTWNEILGGVHGS